MLKPHMSVSRVLLGRRKKQKMWDPSEEQRKEVEACFRDEKRAEARFLRNECAMIVRNATMRAQCRSLLAGVEEVEMSYRTLIKVLRSI